MSIERGLRHRGTYLEAIVDRINDWCESPIEKCFAQALLGTQLASLAFVGIATRDDGKATHHGFYIIPQHRIRTFRADLALVLYDAVGVYRLVVECDGHDFHEKTKEQAAHDKARDRAFLEEGWPVMRFTGSEIHRDADACADQAADFLHRQLMKAHGVDLGEVN